LRLDIVMPAHNEEARIGRTLSVSRDACPDPDIRFLVAMDDCQDRTAEVVQAQADDDDRVELFDYPKLGKGGVIAETFRKADVAARRRCPACRGPCAGCVAAARRPS
jgi:dolichol-phosphate mannosyltransferase